MNPAVSVIIPVYNREKYINKCVDSVLSQTFNDFELILVDDGSTDKSPDICDEYAKKDSRVKVVHKSNGGVSSARNEGLKIATGEYITFVDSDDYIDSDFLEYAINNIEETGVDIFVSGVIHEYCNCDSIEKVEVTNIKKNGVFAIKELLEMWGKEIPLDCLCGPWCKLYRTNLIKYYGVKFDTSMNIGEDTYFNTEMMGLAENAYLSNLSFYHYCKNSSETSLVRSFHKEIYEIDKKIYSKIRDSMYDRQCSDESILRLENRYLTALLGEIHHYYSRSNDVAKSSIKTLIKKIANDEHIRRYKIKTIKKEKLLLMLLKIRAYNLIMLVFDLYYRAKNGNACNG